MPHKIQNQTLYGKRQKKPGIRARMWGELTLENNKRYEWSLTDYDTRMTLRLYGFQSSRVVRLAPINMKTITDQLMDIHGDAMADLGKVKV